MTARKFLLLVAFAPLFLTACSMLGLESDPTYSDKDHDNIYKNGSMVSDNGGIDLFGGDKKSNSDTSGIGVNGFLWRAALDTISFMPIASADPFGGVIITDWYSAHDVPDERTKLNVYIRDRDLRADGVKVSVFRQTRAANGSWNDAVVATTTAGSLENAILTRARQIRMAQKQAQ